MTTDGKLALGMLGTAISATGASLSVTELQAIISIIVTVAGFIISVFIPAIIKIVKKLKEAAKDGEITKEEGAEIASDIKELGEQTVSLIEEVKEESEKSEGDKK